MRIGIIGTGKVGSALAELWVRAGHEVILSSRHPDRLKPLARKLGERATTGSPHQAALAGQVVLLSTPVQGLKKLAETLRDPLRGKVMMNTVNPFEERDGLEALEAIRSGQGTGRWSAALFPGTRMVRAFNTVPAENLRKDAHRKGDAIGIPIASDDEGALEIASLLIRDAGFEAVVVGPLVEGKRFEPGTALFGKALSARKLAEALSLPQAA